MKIDQKFVTAITVAAGGAMAALAASDVVDPKIAAFAAAGVLILGALGINKAPNPKQDAKAVAAYVAEKCSAHTPEPQAPTTATVRLSADDVAYVDQPFQPRPKQNPYDLPWT